MALVNSMLADSRGENSGLVGSFNGEIVETISWGNRLGNKGLGGRRKVSINSISLVSHGFISSNPMVKKINTVWDRVSWFQASLSNKASGFRKTEIRLANFFTEFSLESSLFAMLLNSINNILNHICLIAGCRPGFEFSLQEIFWLFKRRLNNSSGLARMVWGEIFINPNFAMSFIRVPNHSIIDLHGSTLLVSSLESLKRSIKSVKRFSFSQLGSVGKPVGNSFSYHDHMIIRISFNLLVFCLSLFRLFGDEKLRSIGGNKRLCCLTPVLVNELLIFWIIDRIKGNDWSFSFSTSIVLSNYWRSDTSDIAPVPKEWFLNFRH